MFEIDNPDPDEPEPELTTIYKPTGKTIPFGSTLTQRPLRVSLSHGAVKLERLDGVPVNLGHMPGWEQDELMAHVEHALKTGAL